MARGQDIHVGERFKPASRSAFGNPSGEVFEVRDIRVEGCVVPHALLYNVGNPSDQRLISVIALKDINLYLPVELQSAEFHGHLSGSSKL